MKVRRINVNLIAALKGKSKVQQSNMDNSSVNHSFNSVKTFLENIRQRSEPVKQDYIHESTNSTNDKTFSTMFSRDKKQNRTKIHPEF